MISPQIIRDDLKETILKSDMDFINKLALFRKFKLRMNKNFEMENLEQILMNTKLSLKDLSDKLNMREVNLKRKIKDTIYKSEYSIYTKIRLLRKFNIKVPKELKVLRTKEIISKHELSTKELAKRVKVSVTSHQKIFERDKKLDLFKV